jgi:ankyrin repeat protein
MHEDGSIRRMRMAAEEDKAATLRAAARAGDAETVWSILGGDITAAEVNEPNEEDWTALQLACSAGHVKVVEKFMRSTMVDVNQADRPVLPRCSSRAKKAKKPLSLSCSRTPAWT